MIILDIIFLSPTGYDLAKPIPSFWEYPEFSNFSRFCNLSNSFKSLLLVDCLIRESRNT
ncbi:hypothetical protein RINTHH_420 [Richelia intracellularis HH01]|uniref:Uncharacterized protein n=1 Tax=Richelia intracellularis HH01 TaxID=1165094 RepID=M1WX88_9NOST|nr:hypothetical protein RINTHH_420 [Richelia intracellularis HH01]